MEFDYKRIAKPISWSGTRNLKDILYVVFHFTSGTKDTAKNNADFYATGNTRKAGAHIYIDKDGKTALSVEIDKCANAVGNDYRSGDGGGMMYGKITNRNSVSIEMCAYTNGMPTWEQMKKCREVYLWLLKKCPNLKKEIYRHWDVNGKTCPAPMAGKSNKNWKHFKCFVENGYQYKAIVTKKAAIRSSKGVKTGNKIGDAPVGKIYNIKKTVGGWALLRDKDSEGNYRWLAKSKIKEIN